MSTEKVSLYEVALIRTFTMRRTPRLGLVTHHKSRPNKSEHVATETRTNERNVAQKNSPYALLPIVARQRLSKNVPAATNICNDRRIVGRVAFYAVRVVST
jgi:hypothetical protein